MKNVTGRLGARIKELRKLRRFTQERLAEKTEISPQYLSRLEVGQQSPSIETLAKLAEALDVELWEVFDFGHLADIRDLRATMTKIMKEGDERAIRLAVKVVRAVVR